MKMEKLLEIISEVSTESLLNANKEEMRKLAGTLIEEALRKKPPEKNSDVLLPDLDGSDKL